MSTTSTSPTTLQTVVDTYCENMISATDEGTFVKAVLLNYFFEPIKDFTPHALRTFAKEIISGANPSIEYKDVFRSYGVKPKSALSYDGTSPLYYRHPVIRRDIFDLIVLSQPSQKWTEKRIIFVEHYYPNFPIPGRTTLPLPPPQLFPLQHQLNVSLQNVSFISDSDVSDSSAASPRQSPQQLSRGTPITPINPRQTSTPRQSPIVSPSNSSNNRSQGSPIISPNNISQRSPIISPNNISQRSPNICSNNIPQLSSQDMNSAKVKTSYSAKNPRVSKSNISARTEKIKRLATSGIYRAHRKGKICFWNDVFRAAVEENLVSSFSEAASSSNKSYYARKFLKRIRTELEISPNEQEKDWMDILLELQSGNSPSMLEAIRRSNAVRISCLRRYIPSRRYHLTSLRQELEAAFNRCFDPERTRNGFRVNLIEAVQFVLFNVYGIASFKDVDVDIWGDGYLRGKKDVTRLVFRIMNLPLTETTCLTKYSGQSSNHTFTFASYLGKDSRLLMEINVGTSEIVGGKGWLYDQTQKLVNLGANVFCSGDSPWLLRLISCLGSDMGHNCLAMLPLYVKDPDPELVAETERSLIPEHIKDKTAYNVRVQMPLEWKAAMESIGALLPTTVDPETKMRTKLKISLIKKLPDQSLIFMKSNLCACPDATHLLTRCAEQDIVLHALKLNNAGLTNERHRFQKNINTRIVKQFAFELKTDNKSFNPISLSGRDARAIFANSSDLIQDCPDTCDIFEGVYFHNNYIPINNPQAEVLVLLHPDLKINGKISQRAVADLQFSSMNEAVKILRTKNGLKSNLEEYKKHVETYYQICLLLFKTPLTPYKLKLDIIWRLLESGYIKDPWNHMTEAGEKSHHTSNKEYHAKTMRDGGWDDRNKNSEYLDLLFTFWRISRLCLMRLPENRTFRDQINIYIQRFNIDTYSRSETYLEIVQKQIIQPKLAIGKTSYDTLFAGMRFLFMGNFGHHFTHTRLKNMVTECGGLALNDGAADSMTRYAYLPHCYCVLPNRNMIDSFVSCKKPTAAFAATTRGAWTYLNFDFIVECRSQSQLLDIRNFVYEIKPEDQPMFQKTKTKEIAPQLFRQIQSQPKGYYGPHNIMDRAIMPSTSLSNTKASLTRKKLWHQKRRLEKLKTSCASMSQRRWRNFLSQYMIIHRGSGSNLADSELLKEAGREWSAKSTREKINYQTYRDITSDSE